MLFDIYVYKKKKLYQHISIYSDLETINNMIENRCIRVQTGLDTNRYILLNDYDYVEVRSR